MHCVWILFVAFLTIILSFHGTVGCFFCNGHAVCLSMELLDVSFVTVLLSVFPWICRLLSVLCVLFVSFPTILLSVMAWNCRPLAVLCVLFFQQSCCLFFHEIAGPWLCCAFCFFQQSCCLSVHGIAGPWLCCAFCFFLTILLSVFPWNCRPLAVLCIQFFFPNNPAVHLSVKLQALGSVVHSVFF